MRAPASAEGGSPDSLVLTAGGYTLVRDATTGRPSTGTSGIVQEAWTYNDRGELESSDAKVSGSTVLARTYTRDKLGRIDTLTETTSGGSVTRDYDYDLAGRLVAVSEGGVVVEEYDYDANGNRISSSNASGVFAATFDDQDRILTYGDLTFTHLPSGEIATKTDTSTGDVTTFVHDAVGNLRGVGLPDGTTIEYLVDGEGRRVGKRVDGVLERGWLWSGKLRPVAELDASGVVTKRFVYADGVNVPELMVTASATYRLVKDHLGSVRRVVDVSSGAVLQAIEYDAWGRVLSDTNPGAQPFGFAGGLYDADTGLVRFGAREYDAETGRWLEKDRLGFAGGDANLYEYVAGNPATWTDPSGLYAGALAATAGASAIWGTACGLFAFLAMDARFPGEGRDTFDQTKHCYLSCMMSRCSMDPVGALAAGTAHEYWQTSGKAWGDEERDDWCADQMGAYGCWTELTCDEVCQDAEKECDTRNERGMRGR